MHRFRRAALAAGFALSVSLALSARPCAADVRLPHIFGSHMVLQRDLPVHFWGTADPGEKVTVSIGGKEASDTADAQGKWKVELAPLAAGKAGEVSVSGKNTINLKDVLVGEVWVCSGQSNMQMSVQSSNDATKEIQSAKHPEIRLFTVPMRPAAEPASDVTADWKRCGPGSIPAFSAVAYFFGRELHHELGVPIGLIDTSWGGTRIEPWTPPVGFRSVPSLASFLDDLARMKAEYQKETAAAVEKYAKWLPEAEKARDAGRQIPEPPAWPTSPTNSHSAPTGLYNGMIHPLVPFTIRGAIWYQGESNLADGMVYFDKMKALIAGWRSVWGEGDFPFLFVQLAPFHYGNDPTALPKLWEAQTDALAVPKTGMAVINDVGNLTDIHPKDKQDVGKRLALWALAEANGRKGIVYSGPLYKSMSAADSQIRIDFEHVGGGLISRDGKPLTWFTIAGEDKKFVEATAKVEGSSIVVSSPQVPKPVAVRFAWSQDAQPNLANVEGLPASSFRTDKW